MLGAFGVFCFVFPFAIFLMSFDLMPFDMEWMSSLLLVLLGVASAGWMATNFGSVGLGLALMVFGLGNGLETIGLRAGVPFGPYKYTGVLIPTLPNGLPIAIGFAWLLIVVSGLFTAQRMLLRYVNAAKPTSAWQVALLGALLAVGLDLLLEPVAYHVKNYWVWLTPTNEGYYGVPWSNFATWFVAALLMNAGVSASLSRVRERKVVRWGWLPVALFAMNVFMFGVVNLAHGFWVPGAVMVGLLGGLWLFRARMPRSPGSNED